MTDRKLPKKTLAGVVGAAVAAMLFTSIPAEESGRVVDAKIDQTGAAQIRHVSGPQYLRAYLDVVGVPTACDGITKGVTIGQRYSEAECTALLEDELVSHAEGVKVCAPQLWDQGREHPRFAAVSLAYNIGVSAFCSSTAAARFRARRWRPGCDAIVMWNKGTKNGRKVVLPGLINRRARERAACLKGAA
jgi:lysozyme